MQLIICNKCCSKGLDVMQKVAKGLESKGVKTSQKLKHMDKGLMKKYGITDVDMKNEEFLIIEEKNACIPVSWLKNRKGFLDNLVNNLTNWQNKIEKK